MNKIVERLQNGIIKENPTFVLMLGMCPTLAVTTSAINGLGMGLSTTVVLVMSNLMISLLRNIIPDRVRVPAFIVIVASFVTMVQFLVQGFIPSLYSALGIYIPLIVVNCIILGRALSYASSHSVLKSIGDGFKNGVGYLFAISIIGLLREVLGSGTITIMDNISKITGYKEVITVFNNNILPNKLFLTSGGAFILLGILMAIINHFKGVNNNV